MSFGMNRFWTIRLATCFVLVSLTTSLLMAAEDETKKPASPAVPAVAAAAAEPDPFVVPSGSADELMAYIKKIAQLKPQGQDQASVIDFLKKSRVAIAEAAAKILADPKATEDQQREGVALRLLGLSQLIQLGDPTAQAKLEALPGELEKLGLKEAAEMVRGQLVQQELAMALSGAPGAPKLKEALNKFKAFIAKRGNPMSFQMASGLVSQLGQMNKNEMAVGLCDEFAEIFAKSKDPLAAKMAEQFKAIKRRLTLKGNPIEITGTMLDGKPFDWEAFRKDKVVLVDFWATWCAPCISIMPMLEGIYEQYNDKGFEILGISLDHDKKTLTDQLDKKSEPWMTIFDGEGSKPDENGQLEFPNANRYAISSIPFMVLVGKDGKVIGVNLFGPPLEAELTKLLGAPAEKKEAAKSASFNLMPATPSNDKKAEK
jgi:thiol-disulfide isomerase/thioredoxin